MARDHEGYALDEVARQTEALPTDLLALWEPAHRAAAEAVEGLGVPRRICAIGSGDSLHATLAVATAFRDAGVGFHPCSPTEHLTGPPPSAEGVVLVAVSASAANPYAVDAVRAASGRWPTVAVTCQEGPLTEAATTSLVLDPGQRGRAPGIRTYQASLLSLVHLARAMAGNRVGDTAPPTAIALAQRSTIGAAQSAAESIATLVADLPVTLVVAPTADLGVARHLAAKLTETAGIAAFGVDLESWWHVHRFGHDVAEPVVFVVLPGPDREVALDFVRRTAAQTPMIMIAATTDPVALGFGIASVGLHIDLAPDDRPFVEHVIAGPLAFEVARRRMRSPFER